MPNSTLIKFADDIAVNISIIKDDESDYHNEIEQLVKWSNDNNLILNVNKTKELIVDFRQCRNLKDSIIINGSTVEQANIYKYIYIYWVNCDEYFIMDSKC